ncbi:MAG: PQQ-dependent sugar dehydrogenase, partial [Lewinella sp.]|nr:PQQ-dependent sugar dehydrogenase [Lewinella sp.]
AGGNAVLRDNDGDGRADVIKKFGTYPVHGAYGTGMRIHNGYLYYSSQTTVYRQKLTPGEMVPESEMETIVIDDHEESRREHIAKPMAFDNEGHIYIPVGGPSNACQDPKRTPGVPGQDPCPLLETYAGIWRFDADKPNQLHSQGYKYATGIRSLVGLEWNPADSSLYSVMHGRDDLLRLFGNKFSPWQSAVLPSEEFIRIKEGDNYGWPYCYYDQIKEQKLLAPEYGGDGIIVGRCDTFDLPIMGFPGHWAPNDLLFYQGDQFPARYKEGAFVAFHGSTNRAPYPQAGYIVAFIPFRDGKPTGEWEVFADGFARVDTIVSVSDAVFRPMGLATGPDGSLYIGDTEQGAIWRVSYTGGTADFGAPQLAKMEERKDLPHLRTPDEQADNLQKDVADLGALTYRTYCAPCHQGNGKGDSSRFPPLAGADWVTGDKERLINLILNGLDGAIEVNGTTYTGVMPQHAFLSDEQIAEVLTYIRSNFGNEADAVSEEEVQTIRQQIGGAEEVQ